LINPQRWLVKSAGHGLPALAASEAFPEKVPAAVPPATESSLRASVETDRAAEPDHRA